MRRFWRRLTWYAYKLPIMVAVMMIGFVLEYLFLLPFMMACLLSGRHPHSRRPRS